jgi:hypothetical protein
MLGVPEEKIKEMVQIMEAKYGKANRVWVMDRGMVSEKNLEFMRKKGCALSGRHPQGHAEEVRGTAS